MKTEDAVKAAVTLLCITFNREQSRELLDAYWTALGELPPRAVAGAAQRALKECEFMPAPAVLRRFAREWRDPDRSLPPEQPTVATFNYPTPEQQREIRSLVRRLADQKSTEPS
jgi:hypothetical protein